MGTPNQKRKAGAATATDQSKPPTVSLPAFSNPNPLPPLQPNPILQPNDSDKAEYREPETDLTPTAGPTLKGSSDWERGTPTGASSGGSDQQVSAADVTLIVTVLVGMAFAGLEFLARRAQRKLRTPTEAQLTKMAEPSGRLLLRYTPLAAAPESLVDISALAGGITSYLKDGPLTEPLREQVIHIGMPDGSADAAPLDAESSGAPAPTVSFLQ